MDHRQIDGALLERTLRERFGFDTFRPGQREAIDELFEHGRLLCIQPTGHGKSILYQLPAALQPGITLVISPLLALVRDQVHQLNNRFSIPARAINSDQSADDNDRVRAELRAAAAGGSADHVRVVFVAPEQLDNLETFELLTRLPVDLLVVDEAHCISTWGHDFRPAYRQIVNAVRRLAEVRPGLRVLGLTATANARTEQDIAQQLCGSDGARPLVRRAPMDRPSISLRTITVDGIEDKLPIINDLLEHTEGCAVLYCATREQTEIVAGYLSAAGRNCAAYHAGLAPERKIQMQEAFTRSGNQVIAATNALGMGIDKPDIRLIVHVDVPGSITAYYQEVGRAGRDGRPALGVLLLDARDRQIQQHFIRSAQPSPADFDTVLGSLDADADGEAPNRNRVFARSGLHPTKATVVLAELTEQGFVEKRLVKAAGRQRQGYLRTAMTGEPDLSRYARQLEVRSGELEAMLRYGEGQVDCLMQALRIALGDADAPRCGRCSLCAGEQHAGRPVTLEERTSVRRWLMHRELPIPAVRSPRMDAGFALLNGESRGAPFADFMRHRARPERTWLAEDVAALLEERIDALRAEHRFVGVTAVPSRTWAQRDVLVAWAAERLAVSNLGSVLIWAAVPDYRQGELLNNDQRRENVREAMTVTGPLPPGALLLLDDYTGSGATLREAARALRSVGGLAKDHAIVPLTIARVRWRLGARGMI